MNELNGLAVGYINACNYARDFFKLDLFLFNRHGKLETIYRA